MNDESIDEQTDGRRFWRRVRVFVLYPLLCLMLLTVGIVGWLTARDAAAEKQVAAQIELLREQGLPYDNSSMAAYHDRLTTTKDLDEWLQVLSSVDADDFKVPAKLLYPWNDTPAPVPGEEWSEQEMSRAFLAQWRGLLDAAQRLAQTDLIRRLPLRMDSISTQLPWYEKVRQLARVFQLQAADGIYRRHSKQSSDAILNLLGTARSMEGEPILIGQLVCIATEGMAFEQLQRAVELNVLDEDDLRRVKRRLELRSPWHNGWRVGLHGEIGMALPVFDEPARYLGNDFGPWLARVPWRGHDKLAFLEITNKNLELPTQDLTTFRDASRRLNQEIEERFRKHKLRSGFDETISSLLLPAYGAYGEAMLQREMRSRLAILGLAVREFQAKFGKLPDALDDLKQVGTDPAQLAPPGPKPFGFRKLDSSVALWGFQSRNNDTTPDDPPDVTDENHQWDRMWLWQMEK